MISTSFSFTNYIYIYVGKTGNNSDRMKCIEMKRQSH